MPPPLLSQDPKMKQSPDLRRLLDVADITPVTEPTIEESIREYAPTTQPALAQGNEQSRISMFTLGQSERTLLTFIDLEGYPILRISTMHTDKGTEVRDLILNNDQIKLLLRQMTLWLTR